MKKIKLDATDRKILMLLQHNSNITNAQLAKEIRLSPAPTLERVKKLEENGVIRHIQLKTAKLDAKAAYQKVHIALATKPSGCVLWIFFDETTMQLGPFLFFGGKPGEKLPDISQFKIAKHTKGNKDGVKSERPDIREVRKKAFLRYDRIELIYDALFGAQLQTLQSTK